MHKSTQLSLQRDSKASRQPTDKKIQPLFKKRFAFNIEAQGELAQTVEFRPEESKAENSTTDDPLRMNVKQFGISSSTLPSVEDTDVKIKKLKSEKLEVLKDLCSYSKKFSEDLCMRSRVGNIKALSGALLEMSETAMKNLQEENDLLGYLNDGLNQLENEQSTQNELELQVPEPTGHRDCLLIDSYPCIAGWEKSPGENRVSLRISTRFLPKSINIEVPCSSDNWQEEVYPNLTFSRDSGEISAKYTESGKNKLKVVAKLMYPNDQLLLFSITKPQNVLFSAKLHSGKLQLEVEDNEIDEYFTSRNSVKLAEFISTKFILQYTENRPQLTYFHLNQHPFPIYNELAILPATQFPDIFAGYNKAVFSCNILIKHNDLSVFLMENAISERFRLTIELNGHSATYLEEHYPAQFKFLRFFDLFDMSLNTETIIRSLELQNCIEGLLSANSHTNSLS